MPRAHTGRTCEAPNEIELAIRVLRGCFTAHFTFHFTSPLQIIGVLQRYIPTAVSNKLRSGHVGYIAELREVSVTGRSAPTQWGPIRFRPFACTCAPCSVAPPCSVTPPCGPWVRAGGLGNQGKYPPE